MVGHVKKRNKELKKEWEKSFGIKRTGLNSRTNKKSSLLYSDYISDPDLFMFENKICIFCQNDLSKLWEQTWAPNNYSVSIEFRDPLMIKSVDICNNCGWWRASQRLMGLNPDFMISDGGLAPFNGMIGHIKKFNVADVSNQLNEIRDFISIHYDKRMDIHPKLFEQVVSSVFSDLGYHSEATAYSNDGGIDVILNKNNIQIGVQVKRTKNKIEVEQIRSLAGSLLLGSYHKGIFVTTSSYRSGAYRVVQEYKLKGYPIELIDAERFYDQLNLAQKEVVRNPKEWFERFNNIDLNPLHKNNIGFSGTTNYDYL